MAESNNPETASVQPLHPVASSTTHSVEENTPLLSSGVNDAESPASPQTPLGVRVLTTLSFVSSMATLILLIALYITARASPYSWDRYYPFTDSIQKLSFFSLLALLVSFFNLRKIHLSGRLAFPLALNLLLDVLLAFCLFEWAAELAYPLFPGYDRCDDYPDGNPDWECERWQLAWQILGGVTIAVALIASLTHLILFIIRCVAAFRSRFWTRPFPWTFPAGQFTVEFTIKVLRQEREGEDRL